MKWRYARVIKTETSNRLMARELFLVYGVKWWESPQMQRANVTTMIRAWVQNPICSSLLDSRRRICMGSKLNPIKKLKKKRLENSCAFGYDGDRFDWLPNLFQTPLQKLKSPLCRTISNTQASGCHLPPHSTYFRMRDAYVRSNNTNTF